MTEFYIHPNARAAAPPSANPNKYKKPPMGEAEDILKNLSTKREKTAKEKELEAEKFAAGLISKLYGK